MIDSLFLGLPACRARRSLRRSTFVVLVLAVCEAVMGLSLCFSACSGGGVCLSLFGVSPSGWRACTGKLILADRETLISERTRVIFGNRKCDVCGFACT